jgi:membrane dipeptidase
MTMAPSRRRFLSALAGASLIGAQKVRAADIDPRTEKIVAGTIAIDMHSHLRIQPGEDPPVDLAGEIKRSGFSAVCQTYNVDDVVYARRAGGDYRYNLQALDFEDRLLARNKMRRALSMADLKAAHAAGQPIIVQSAEGAQFLEGKLERLEEAYGRGLRHVQPLHERDDAVAPLGDVYTAADHLGGLTPFGADMIRESERLGMVVDLAHGTSQTLNAALRVARQPLIVSHAGMARDAPGKPVTADIQRRLLSDEDARAVSTAGGVVGVWWRQFASVKDYVAAIKDRAAAFGVDHVGIGTDTNLIQRYILPYTNQVWPDQKAGFFFAVADEMLRQGCAPGDIAKIGGGNYCRVFAQVTAGHA